MTRQIFAWTVDYASGYELEPRILKAQFGDGYSQRIQDGINAQLKRWSVSLTARTQAEASAILEFFEARGGWESFDWVAPLDHASTGATFGTGDGSRVAWPLLDAYGRRITRLSGTPVIHRTDWQGRKTLYSTPRTNYILRSQEFGNSAWAKFASGTATLPVVTADTGVAPDGTSTADRCQFDRGAGTSGSDISTITQTMAATIGASYTGSIWLKSNTGANQSVMLFWSGWAGGTITNVVTVTPVWQRFSLTAAAANATIGIQFGCRASYGQQVIDVLAWGAQVSAVDGAYIPTTSSTVTVTDYAQSASGIITLAQAPLAAATLDWDGATGYANRPVVCSSWRATPTQYGSWDISAEFMEVMA